MHCHTVAPHIKQVYTFFDGCAMRVNVHGPWFLVEVVGIAALILLFRCGIAAPSFRHSAEAMLLISVLICMEPLLKLQCCT